MTPVTEAYEPKKPTTARQIHGKRLYADRLCKHGKVEEAKAYLERHGLPFPPFPDAYAAAKLGGSPSSVGDAVSQEQQGAGSGAMPPMESPTEPPFAQSEVSGLPNPTTAGPDISRYPPGQPETGAAPVGNEGDSAPPSTFKAKVLGFCVNPRVVAIRLETGERATMWSDRRLFRQNETVEVRLERGTIGINAVFEEVKKPL